MGWKGTSPRRTPWRRIELLVPSVGGDELFLSDFLSFHVVYARCMSLKDSSVI